MLTIRDLRISFRRYEGLFARRELACVHGADLELGRGEMLAVVGASGAGKSLLAHAVLGVLAPNAIVEGRIDFEGTALTPARQAALRGREIALVPQSSAYLDPLVRSDRQVVWAARRAGVGGRSAELALSRYGLGAGKARVYPHALSGGMARRVLLAISTVADARLIIADEPTTGLDAANARLVLQHLRGLADEGKAVMVITHDLSTVLPFADRVSIMREGRTIETAAADRFCDKGARGLPPYSLDLWRALPRNGFIDALGTR